MPDYLTAEALVWLRIAFATLAFHTVGVFLQKTRIDWKTHWKEMAICGFFGTSANMYLFFKGLEVTYPINAAVLMLATPVFVAIFDHFRLKVLPQFGFLVALISAAYGCFKLITIHHHTFTSETIIGDIYIVINAVFYAIYLVRIKKLTAIYPPVSLNKWTFTFGLIYITPITLFSLFSGETTFTTLTHIPINIWYKIGYILVFTSFLVYLMNAYAVKIAGPTLAGIYIYLQPLLATIIAFILKTDQVSFEKIGWILIVLLSTFYATRKTPQAKKLVASAQ
jgi:drug/metabolite transporter (DMT)-like permease